MIPQQESWLLTNLPAPLSLVIVGFLQKEHTKYELIEILPQPTEGATIEYQYQTLIPETTIVVNVNETITLRQDANKIHVNAEVDIVSAADHQTIRTRQGKNTWSATLSPSDLVEQIYQFVDSIVGY